MLPTCPWSLLLTSPGEDRQGGSESSAVCSDITREYNQGPTGVCSSRGGGFWWEKRNFLSYYYCKAKVILMWGVRCESWRGKKHFSVLLSQDLVSKASVTTLHVHFGFGWVPLMDSLLSNTWICAGSAKEATWIGALCCILPEAFGCLGFPDNSLSELFRSVACSPERGGSHSSSCQMTPWEILQSRVLNKATKINGRRAVCYS